MSRQVDAASERGIMPAQCCRVVELRRYTLHPGQRDTLISLFDEKFVESQEDCGATIVGQFRHRTDPDAFVWVRGFGDMDARLTALTDFYSSDIWRANAAAANATMVDVSNVRLLRPAHPDAGFDLRGRLRPNGSKVVRSRRLVVVHLRHIKQRSENELSAFFAGVRPALAEIEADLLAYFVSETSTNNFPGLPVIENEHVFVWFLAFRDLAAYERHTSTVSTSEHYRDYRERLQLGRAEDTWVLEPSARSLIP